ncbi:hypothetical protein Nepgr_021363 [Nepenthes gracilis]|uniref:RING-type E3 ubiquitin transferase n=1 Tax=Nepenthes gracilis TaxID=150966 RepID=A0AAD3SYP4_NEPGR|nr:hypothetical protein Nepgr_021363 [Nepenthes gracilis]
MATLFSKPTPIQLTMQSLLFFTISVFFSFTSSSPLSSSPVAYSKHCNHIVAESTQSSSYLVPPQFLRLSNAYVRNAQHILGPYPQIVANFVPQKISKTLTLETLEIEAVLTLRVQRSFASEGNFGNRRLFRVYGGPRSRIQTSARFQLYGYWSSTSGQLCMVGSGSKRSKLGNDCSYNVVFKLNYPKDSTITSSLVTGTLESLDSDDTGVYFSQIIVMGFSMMNYEYSVINEELEHGGLGGVASLGNASLNLGTNGDCYDLIRLSDGFELECDGNNCSEINGILSKFMSANAIDCSNKEKMRILFGFSDVSSLRNGYQQPFVPSKTLVGEGVWNSEKSQICFVACRIMQLDDLPTNSSVGDCIFRLNFTIPAVLSIMSRSAINGQIWSNKSASVRGNRYVDRIQIRTSGVKQAVLPNMRYQFTQIERARNYCANKKMIIKHKGRHFPNAYSSDMKFGIRVRQNKGQTAFGHAIPLSVGPRFLQDSYATYLSEIESWKTPTQVNRAETGLLNISYRINFTPAAEFKLGAGDFVKQVVDISAEGIYDTETGLLCMIGCWNRELDEKSSSNRSTTHDCEIFVGLQFPSLNSNKGDLIKGTIESKRRKLDPLYFDTLELSSTSILAGQAANTIWRIDLEITMVLISNTLACIFVGLQLFHTKNHPEILPFISIMMLAVLTLGHMIPLLLNFDAFLSSSNKQHVLLRSSGWLEVNEVLVRVITMVAFLLECWLLQLTWCSKKSADSSQINLWAAEKKVISLFLPLYIIGALIAWLLHPWRSLRASPYIRRGTYYRTFSLWGDLKSYAGLILDAFLLPQITFNMFSNNKEKALCPPYYFGTTIVRLMPHAYDLIRAHSSALKIDLSFIYANPRLNYYSTAWDIVISCCGFGFAMVVYLQQRYGGSWILPPRLKGRFAYESSCGCQWMISLF